MRGARGGARPHAQGDRPARRAQPGRREQPRPRSSTSPIEVIELLQSGALSEGHGRALLLADDHGARRTLAREAASRGWSVRVAEERARASNEPPAKPEAAKRAHPTRSRQPRRSRTR